MTPEEIEAARARAHATRDRADASAQGPWKWVRDSTNVTDTVAADVLALGEHISNLGRQLDDKAAEIERLRFALKLAHEQQEIAVKRADLLKDQLDYALKTLDSFMDAQMKDADKIRALQEMVEECEGAPGYRCSAIRLAAKCAEILATLRRLPESSRCTKEHVDRAKYLRRLGGLE